MNNSILTRGIVRYDVDGPACEVAGAKVLMPEVSESDFVCSVLLIAPTSDYLRFQKFPIKLYIQKTWSFLLQDLQSLRTTEKRVV